MTADFIILLMGVYLVGGGLAMLLSPGRLTEMIDGLGDQPAVSYVAGALMAPLGAAVLVNFHGFADWKEGVATVIGAGLLLEGWLLMAAPKTLMSFARPFIFSPSAMRVIGAIILVAAALAIWTGLPR